MNPAGMVNPVRFAPLPENEVAVMIPLELILVALIMPAFTIFLLSSIIVNPEIFMAIFRKGKLSILNYLGFLVHQSIKEGISPPS
jgi:hypothetical protein